ncbi:MAG TPA: bifunctional riboflavin kinase/FAD synthetase [Magnetospirillaceae bacterium]|jgi:riboflavin kinase/FMN adenylyltransferase
MRLFRHFDETPGAVRGGAVALGNFDGLHRGHRAVLDAARMAGAKQKVPWGVMSFEPHPRAVLRPPAKPFRLTSMRVKARLIEEMGADFLLLQHFDRAFASISATNFIDRVLVGALNVSEVVVGQDYVFGQGRMGDAELLTRSAAAHGFAVTVIDPVLTKDATAYSSTVVREALAAGRLADVRAQLGRNWEIDGHVRKGDQRGRELGYPTANIAMGDLIHPAAGVYAVRIGIEGQGATEWYSGVAYCGPRPTFDKTEVVLEAHLFDFAGDLYGKPLRVAMVEFIRPDKRFDDIKALIAQMDDDAKAARAALAVSVSEEANP